MDTLIAGVIITVGLANVAALIAVALGAFKLSQHVIDSTVALKLSAGDQRVFSEGLRELREARVIDELSPEPETNQTVDTLPTIKVKSATGPEEVVTPLFDPAEVGLADWSETKVVR